MSARSSILAASWRKIGGPLGRLVERLRPIGPRAPSRGPDGQGEPAPRGVEPLRARIGGGRSAPCVFVVVIGVPSDDLATVVDRLVSEGGPRPVFLTDDDRFEIFRRHRAIFEYLPPVEPAADLDVELYRLRRLALLRRKWQPVRIVGFGAEAARIIQMWRASPFEDRRIEELTGGPGARNAAPGGGR